MNPHYTFVAARARRRCEYCRAPEVVANCFFEVEHVIPRALGGSDDYENSALACRSCNVRKRDQISWIDGLTGSRVPIFNPRSDRWEEQTEIDLEASLIIGRTPTGRATAEILDLNHPQQVVARSLWISYRLYP